MQMYNGGSSYDGPTMKKYLAQLETITSLEKKVPYVIGGHNPLKGFDCSGLVIYYLPNGNDIGNPGASTLARKFAVVGGYIDDIGWENLPRGAIVGKLVWTSNGKALKRSQMFSFDRISKNWKYKLEHVGVFDSYSQSDDIVSVFQATPKGADRTKKSSREMKNKKWNIWFFVGALFDSNYCMADDE